jgi:hypothetical protein
MHTYTYTHIHTHTHETCRYLHMHRVLPIHNGQTLIFEQGYAFGMKPRPSKISVQLFFAAAKQSYAVRPTIEIRC